MAAETILTPDQQKVLDLFQADPKLPELFYLSGGTALAEFYLKHRRSDDLDFFIDEKEFPFVAVRRSKPLAAMIAILAMTNEAEPAGLNARSAESLAT